MEGFARRNMAAAERNGTAGACDGRVWRGRAGAAGFRGGGFQRDRQICASQAKTHAACQPSEAARSRGPRLAPRAPAAESGLSAFARGVQRPALTKRMLLPDYGESRHSAVSGQRSSSS
eukprot:1292758-Rhodomonas_salina.2